MSDYDKAIIIWLDENISRSEYCPLLKKAFVKILVQKWDRATFLDDKTIEIYAENDFSKSSYWHKTSAIELYAFTNEEECVQCIEDNREKKIFFIITFSSGKRIVPQIIKKYPEALPKPTNHRFRSVYVFCNNSPDADQLWSVKYSEYLLVFPCEIDLLKKLINDIAHYFISLGQKQYDIGMTQSIRQSLEYYDWAQILLGRVFGGKDAWQCKETTRDLDKLIAQSQVALHQSSDIDQSILSSKAPDARKAEASNSIAQISFNATSCPAPIQWTYVSDSIASAPNKGKSRGQTQELGESAQCSSEILVYLQVPSIQTENFKNLQSTLQYLFASNLVLSSGVENCFKLSQANDTELIVQTLLSDDDKLILDKICSMDKSISIYLLGVEPDTVNTRTEFFTRYPQVCAISNNPKELANKVALDVVLKSRVMGDRYARDNDKKHANIMYDQCIGLLNRLKVLSTNNMDNRN
jgi:hypothetical protein